MKKLLPIICIVLTATASQAQEIKAIKRLSLAPDTNAQGKSYSYDPEISGNGRYVIFTSTADNFAADGVEKGAFHEHVYLRDTVSNETKQLDLTSEGKTGSPGLAFNTNLRTFGSSFDPHVSRDGKYVVFVSSASNISPDGQGESFGAWTYIKNLESGEIKRIPFATEGDNTKGEYPTYLAINADGSVVVVISIIGTIGQAGSDKWELTVYNRNSHTTTLINTGINGNKFNPGISDDGKFIVFENQVEHRNENNEEDFSGPTYAYLYDVDQAQTFVLNDGKAALSPAISGDGKMIAYSDSSAIPTVIKLRDRVSGTEKIVTSGLDNVTPNGISEFASLSIDGRYLAFLSSADNLTTDDANGLDDIFVYDNSTGKTTLVSVQTACDGVNSKETFNTGPPAINSDGSVIAFTVLERLIPADKKDKEGNVIEVADTNSFDDVYLAELDLNATPDVFKKGITPATPLVSVDCKGMNARIFIEDLLKSKGTQSSIAAIKNSAKIKKISQKIIITKLASAGQKAKTVKQITAKRNTLVTSGLAPGNYSAQVKATAKLSNGETAQSRLSIPANFTITGN